MAGRGFPFWNAGRALQVNKFVKSLLFASVSAALIGAAARPAAAWDGNVISGAKTSRQIIALTFDDGPDPEKTPEILDILAEYGIHATFFAVGENVKAHPELVQREIDEGHEIGNHTFTHTFLKNADSGIIDKELNGFDDMMLEMFEYKPKLLRPPGGLYNISLCDTAKNMGYTVVLWSIDTRDWAHTPVDKICKNICDSAKSGDIILMHDYICGKSPTPAALRVIIPRLIDEGFDFVTVSELMEETQRSDAAP